VFLTAFSTRVSILSSEIHSGDDTATDCKAHGTLLQTCWKIVLFRALPSLLTDRKQTYLVSRPCMEIERYEVSGESYKKKLRYIRKGTFLLK